MRVEQTMKEMDYQRQFTPSKILWQVLYVGLVGIVAITVLQDFIHSRLNSYSFYISESLLYKTVWILFLPLLFLQFRVLKTTKIKFAFRVSLAILLPIKIHLLLTPLMVWFVSATFYSHTYSFPAIFKYTLSEDFYKLLIVYSLSAIIHTYYAKKAKFKPLWFKDESPITIQISSAMEDKAETHLEKIVVSNGRNYVSIATDDILYLTAATPYISIHLQNKRYLYSATLKSISEKLDTNCFVRVHKSAIVNLSKVISYKSRLNGDYDLLLENGDKIRLSRNYTENFKKLFNSTPQVK